MSESNQPRDRNGPGFLSVADVAKRLGVSPGSVYHRFHSRGSEHVKRVGRRIYFREEVLNSDFALAG